MTRPSDLIVLLPLYPLRRNTEDVSPNLTFVSGVSDTYSLVTDCKKEKEIRFMVLTL